MNGSDYGNIIQNLLAAPMIKDIFLRVESILLKNISIHLNIIMFLDKKLNFQNIWHTLSFLTQRLNFAFKIGLGIF